MRTAVYDISVTKTCDKSSPVLMLACCNGTHIPRGSITVRKAGEQPLEYIKIDMETIIVTGVQHTGSDASDLLTESLSLNFAKFAVEYQQQGPDGKAQGGPVKMGWDVKANVKT
jgi:type VI secretion system secreted protein Hcp